MAANRLMRRHAGAKLGQVPILPLARPFEPSSLGAAALGDETRASPPGPVDAGQCVPIKRGADALPGPDSGDQTTVLSARSVTRTNQSFPWRLSSLKH